MASLTIEAYYAAIRDAIAGNDLALAAQQARVGLENHPKEPEFAKIEIVALIKMEKPAQALDVLERARGARLLAPKAMSYEAAYCHFALENYAKAEDALKSVEAGPAADRLAAQIAYKSNRFETCIEIYERLLTSVAAASPEHDEILLNLAAAKAAAAQVAGRKQIGAAADALIESYELMFNQATELLAYGQAKEAAKLLEAAAVRAEAVLTEDNWTAEDIQSEVSTIDAQRAVALQCLGKISDARAIYARLLSGKSLDRATRGAVVHNAAVLMARAGGTTDFLLASQIKRAIQIPGTSTSGLSRYQRALMAYNMAVVQFFQQQFAAARRSLARLASDYPECAVGSAGILSTSISLKMGDTSRALNELLAMSHALGAGDGIRATLATAQIAIALGETKRAADVLCAWRDKARGASLAAQARPDAFARYYFGISQLIGCLLPESAAVVAEAAVHLFSEVYRQQIPDAALLGAVGDCLVYAGDIEKARECFGDAAKANVGSGSGAEPSPSMFMPAVLAPGGLQATAQLLKGYDKRKQILSSIPGLSLRAARRLQPQSTAESTQKERVSAAAAHKRRERNRAQRRRKLARAPPKSYQPGRTPDSERWIPLRQRSSYRPRGRQERQHSGAQGGATAAGSGLGGTGSARIARKGGSLAISTATSTPQSPANESEAPAPVSVSSSKAKPENAKGKTKGKPKGKGKGKKSSW